MVDKTRMNTPETMRVNLREEVAEQSATISPHIIPRWRPETTSIWLTPAALTADIKLFSRPDLSPMRKAFITADSLPSTLPSMSEEISSLTEVASE